MVELVISMGLLSIIMATFVVVLNSSSDALMTGCAKGVLSARLDQGLKTVEADLREASAANVHSSQSGLPEGQCAVLMPSARDSAGVFRVDSAGYPAWQAAVVYCPYVTSGGVSQLRRYKYYAAAASFPFQFDPGQPITETEVRLRGQDASVITIDRLNGNPSLPAGQNFQVLCPGLTGFQVTLGSPAAVTLKADCAARGNAVIANEETAYVGPRN